MKNLVLISMVLVVFNLSACAQNQVVPEKVKTAFNQKFPDAKNIKWEMEDETEWEAEFKMNGTEYSSNFDKDGNWKETEYEIKNSELPAVVQSTIKTEFNEYEIEEAEISETAEGKFYEIELEKGETTIEVKISTDGKVLKKEIEEDDEEDDEE